MSDYYGKNPNQPGERPDDANPWQRDPFTAFGDSPLDASSLTPPPDFGGIPSYRRTASAASGNPTGPESRPGKPDFTATPAGYGVNRPVFHPDTDFSAVGPDAPTRVARPAVPSRNAEPLPPKDEGDTQNEAEKDEALPSTPPRHRRAGRMNRGVQAAPVPAPEIKIAPQGAETFEHPEPVFDPFEAGDSETVADPKAGFAPSAQEVTAAQRRPVASGARFTGARTAIPQSASPLRREPSAAPREADGYPEETELPDDRPPRWTRPAVEPDDFERRPAERGQPPVRPRAEGQPAPRRGQPVSRQEPSASLQEEIYAARQPSGHDPRRRYPEPPQQASVERPRYRFEDEYEEVQPPRRGKVLVPLLVTLLVLGGLLAGVLLPDWEGMGGGLGTAMNKIKTAVTGVFGDVKGLVFPEEAGIKSFSASPSSATAPVDLVFTLQASSSVTDIRILDQNGLTILEKALNDADTPDSEVTKNSGYNIWTLHHTFTEAYSGLFTAQSQKKDGTWDEGTALAQDVNIAAPVAVEPPVQGFTAEPTQGEVPAAVDFTVVTSMDVTAIQILNDDGDAVAEAYLNDADSLVLENDGTLVWSLAAEFDVPYSGGFYAGYETDADLLFTRSDYGVTVTLTEADSQQAENMPEQDDTTPEGTPAVIETPTPSPAPTETPEPTPSPTPSPTPEPTAITTPEPTAVPILSASVADAALPSALKLTAKAYEGTKSQETYSRQDKVVVNDPFKYAVWDQNGVLTFRGGPFRQNAVSGTVEIKSKSLTEIWKVAMEGSIRSNSGTLTGVTWPGQPLIVKWPTQLRAILDINQDFKDKTALKEVIVGSQNGYLYFLDLVTGEATRDAIDLSWPSNGVLSLQTNASPMLAVGQHISMLAKKTVKNGLHLFSLLSNKELTLLNGKDKLMRTNFSGFNGAPLFDMNTGTMIVGGENGLLYTMEPNDEFDHILGTLKISPSYQRYSWLASGQKKKTTNIDGAVAMYGTYVYFGDQTGILQCVDVNTLAPVWAADTGDNVDAAVALDMEDESTVALYTGNTIKNQGRSGVCTIRRYNALTGEETWAYQVPDLVYTTKADVGCEASPVVGQNSVSDLVYFTVTNGGEGATLYALKKDTGAVQWSQALESPCVSSPVAVYNLLGDAWLLQAESNGKLHLMNAKTGEILNTLQLEGEIVSSPAVYRDVLVIATTGTDVSYIYGIKLE